MMAALAPAPKFYEHDANGEPLNNGKVYTYLSGTNTPLATYTDAGGGTPNQNPVRLDSSGRANIWLLSTSLYRFEVYSSTDVLQYGPIDGIGGSVTLQALASSSGASLVGYTEQGTGAVTQTVTAVLRERIRINARVGVAADFDPATGIGTDSRAGIQLALEYARSKPRGAVVSFTNSDAGGGYYTGTGYVSGFTSPGGAVANVQLLLGHGTTANAASNIDIDCEGAAVYAGAPGRMLAIANGFNVRIHNPNFRGFAGGTLGASRELDNLVMICLNSKHITIEGGYISNCLGWQVAQYGDPGAAGGGTGFTCFDVRLVNTIFKSRFGDGVVASSGGSMTQQNFQFTDIQDCLVTGCTIYGRGKFEPNLNGQYMAGIFVTANMFRSGCVTAVVPAGVSTYWQDEALGLFDSGGSVIEQALSLDGIPGAPKVHNNTFSNNDFEYGTIVGNTEPYVVKDVNNTFWKGLHVVGSHGNNARRFSLSGNVAEFVIDGESELIKVRGNLSIADLSNNKLLQGNHPVIADDGTGRNAGTNVFSGNASIECTTSPVAITPSNTVPSYEIGTGNPTEATPQSAFLATLIGSSVAGTQTYSRQYGYFTPDGQKVAISGRVTITAKDGAMAGNVLIGGLPFASNASANLFGEIIIDVQKGLTNTAGYTQFLGRIAPGTSVISITEIGSASSGLSVTVANTAADTDLLFSGWYYR